MTRMKRVSTVRTKIWRDDCLADAELLHGRFADYAYDVHTHDKACFALITRGAIRIRMRCKEFLARAGDLYAIDAEDPHAGWPIDNGGWSLRTLYVDAARLQAIIGDDVRTRVPSPAGPIICDPYLNSLLYAVHASSEDAEPALAREEPFCQFVAWLFARHTRAAPPLPATSREEKAIRTAREYLDEHLDEKVHLSDVASAAGLPPFRLFRAFRRATGMTPHGYQRQARIRSAARMIRLGHSLSEVAMASGFADQAHLTRSFRRSMAVTPGAYREIYI
jgi:AraC-like DNA-binding protein